LLSSKIISVKAYIRQCLTKRVNFLQSLGIATLSEQMFSGSRLKADLAQG
jgi:hypothetical protein